MRTRPIIIFGVCHTVATVDETLGALAKSAIGRDTVVFVEPKRSILDGTLRCDNPDIMGFFRRLLDFLFSRGVEVIPLNPDITPSHYTSMLNRKIALQLAEEEYMVDVIAGTETDKRKVVIIGDIHAPRMRNLLRARGLHVRYRSLSQRTPSDEMLVSMRDALEGKRKMFIGIRWLTKFRHDLRTRLGLSPDANIPAIFYGDKELYHKYLREAHSMEVRGEEDTAPFMDSCDSGTVKRTSKVKDSAYRLLKKTGKKEHHASVTKNQLR